MPIQEQQEEQSSPASPDNTPPPNTENETKGTPPSRQASVEEGNPDHPLQLSNVAELVYDSDITAAAVTG